LTFALDYLQITIGIFPALAIKHPKKIWVLRAGEKADNALCFSAIFIFGFAMRYKPCNGLQPRMPPIVILQSGEIYTM